MYRSVGNTRLDCCSIFSIACLLFPRLCCLFICGPVLIVCLKWITSSLHSTPPSSTQEWFNVQLKLSKAIDARCVMIPADLQMELLIPLSLLSPPHLLPPFSSSGTILVDSSFWTLPLALLLSSVCCGCRAVAPTKIEMKKKQKHIKR